MGVKGQVLSAQVIVSRNLSILFLSFKIDDLFLYEAEDSTLRVFSTVTDLLNRSLGVASYNRKVAKKHKQINNPLKMQPIIGNNLKSCNPDELIQS
jgi:hypothetical protein